ncbi:hypothetical protein CXG81DRAFT_27874 [Caulochytrium protostelioides]|uniref:Phosphoinositide phospholipase C n=1 Tax=Caulochytrium protostelioides TaxID=1555241 RepID=A0A4V1IU54_9FUNG|nr:hypothetical protein CXG81DRAFT_27874 [Caulochytrium protostelioides]|eukprot:RKO99368.1 hypothetical protein CXG81DRAFT_27874 [Caulochytrium protostelioides]
MSHGEASQWLTTPPELVNSGGGGGGGGVSSEDELYTMPYLASASAAVAAAVTSPSLRSLADVEVAQIPALLAEGMVMTKIPNKPSSKPQDRRIRVDPQLQIISWETPKRHKERRIDFHALREIRLGQNTRAFELHGARDPAREARCFSLIYVDRGKYKMLNLCAQSALQSSLWVSGLHMLVGQTQISDSQNPMALPKNIVAWIHKCWHEVRVAAGGGSSASGNSGNSGGATGSSSSLLHLALPRLLRTPSEQHMLTLDQAGIVMRKLSLCLSQKELKSTFKQARLCNDGQMITLDAFERLYRMLRFRPEVNYLFSLCCSEDPYRMTLADFRRFWIDVQRNADDATLILKVWNKYKTGDLLGEQGYMDSDHFSAFLISANNAVAQKARVRRVWQDMTKPLSRYYISTSHNTYLLGDQITGPSSPEAYIRALQQGCRCVELDCWEGPSGLPLIYHGRTLTGRISFTETIEAIARYAFVASPYPVILSLELHCSEEQQTRMAEVLCRTFGEQLYTGHGRHYAHAHDLPSPEALKGRILLKAKVLRDHVMSPHSTNTTPTPTMTPVGSYELTEAHRHLALNPEDQVFASLSRLDSAASVPQAAAAATGRPGSATPGSTRSLPALAGPCAMSMTASAASNATERATRATTPIALPPGPLLPPPSLLPLPLGHTAATVVPSLAPVPFRVSTKAQKNLVKSQRLLELVALPSAKFIGLEAETLPVVSLSEKKAASYFSIAAPAATLGLAADGVATLPSTTAHSNTLVRVYPDRLRLNSSNMDPVAYWAHGIQLVALNRQTRDRGLQLEQAFFESNGGCGYVLRPPLDIVPPVQTLSIRIISGQHLASAKDVGSRATIHVAVEIESRKTTGTASLSSDRDAACPVELVPSNSLPQARHPVDTFRARSPAVESNGLNAAWDTAFSFPVQRAELTLLRIVVHEMDKLDSKTVLGESSVCVANLAQGYRHVPLRDSTGDLMRFSTLFLHIHLDPAPRD